MPAPTKRTLATIGGSPAVAVAAAFLLRMFLLWLSHHGEDRTNPKFLTVGLEANLIAYSLANGKGFFGPYPNYQSITAWLAPVYPFLWAVGNKLFNLTAFGATIFSQVMNCVFSAATCWPIYGIGKKVFGGKVGLASAWLWVFLPYAVLLPLEWTWDQSLSALMLAAILYVTYELIETDSPLAMTGYGLLWALGALVNPTLCILLPILLGWLTIRRARPMWTSLATVAKVTLVFLLALAPWTIRNYYAVDGLVFVKSNFGLEFWLGNNPQVKEIYTPDRHPNRDMRERMALIFNGEPAYNRYKQRQAIAYIRKYPRVFLRNVAARFVDTWTANYDSRQETWILALGLGRADVWFCTVFSVVSFAGLIFATMEYWRESLPLAVCLLLFPIPYYITHTASRYRHPIDPVMTILAVYFITRALRYFSIPAATPTLPAKA